MATSSGEGSKSPGFIRREIAAFWRWYEQNYLLNVAVATALFVLQIVHLAWLGLDVVAERLVGHSYFPAGGVLLGLLVIVDLFEIPAIISVSLLYINEMRKKRNAHSLIYLLLLNSQWLHILWITDEFVVSRVNEGLGAWPLWLAWVAIGIDYLELPVMVDTLKRLIAAIVARRSVAEVFGEDNAKTGTSRGAILDPDDVSITQVQPAISKDHVEPRS